jgi:hypothetical protein
MNAYSQLDTAVWREYVDDLPRLHAEAEAIRARLQEGALQPAKATPVVEDVDIEQQHTETFRSRPRLFQQGSRGCAGVTGHPFRAAPASRSRPEIGKLPGRP